MQPTHTFNRTRTIKAAIGVAGAGMLAVAGATVAHAATTVSEGHVDIVEVECDDGDFTVGSHIDSSEHGELHVPSNQIGNYDFLIDESVADTVDTDIVDWGSGDYVIDADADAAADSVIPDLGFRYEVDGEGCPETIEIAMDSLSGGDVVFDSLDTPGSMDTTTSDRLTLDDTVFDHVHGLWFYQAPSHQGYDYELEFTVYETGTSNVIDTVDPVAVRVQP